MNKKLTLLTLLTLAFAISGCDGSSGSDGTGSVSSLIGSSSGEITSGTTSHSPIWDKNSVYYEAEDIRLFGSGTPAGVANYQSSTDTVVIWNVDASLDNYGGVQTPVLDLDFSKAVIFEMEVVSSYSQYIVKLAVDGEIEYYYVLSDEGTPGLISINVVDAMLSTKYRERNTQPDPGYVSGWKYKNQVKNCTFHILAKGPDGERQTAELVLDHIAIYNNQPAVTGVTISSSAISGGTLEKLKGSPAVTLSAEIAPETITDQSIIWSSSDPSVAGVDSDGVVSFLSVGTATISAKSRVDQSKQALLPVNVTSGFEDVSLLKTELNQLTYGGSSLDSEAFLDLFKTTWGGSIAQEVTFPTMAAVSHHVAVDGLFMVENYFDATVTAHVNEAQARLDGSVSKIAATLTGGSGSEVYRRIDGALYRESYAGSLGVAYAANSGGWARLGSYVEEAIVVRSNGNVYKYRLAIQATSLLADNQPADFMDPDSWTVPDRTKQTENAVIHALSPASIRIESGQLVMKQNKYPEAKYCFGGIVSSVYDAGGAPVQMLLNVTALNQMNEYVKTMWEIKVIYYQANGTTVVSSNPLKVASGNVIGQHTVTFTPSYDHFRLYLVVNGSDIGAQFSNAEMRLDRLKIYTLDGVSL
ncbi:MAG: Ig-like domain-containing protein [Bacilli bacterium]